MSQFPMDTVGRNMGIGGMPRLEDVGLVAPGLAVNPPDYRGAQMAGQLLDALSGVARGINAVGAVANAETQFAEAERARADAVRAQLQERANREAEALDRGQASLDASMLIPRFRQQVEKGDIAYRPGMEEEAVKQMLDQMTEGRSGTYRERLYQVAAPNMLDFLIDKSDRDEKRAQTDAADIAGADAVTASSTDELDRAINAVKAVAPGLPERAIQEATVLRALRAHARSGDSKRFEMVMGVAEKLFPDQVENEKRVLMGTLERDRNERENSAVEGFAQYINIGGTPDQLEDYITESLATGDLSAKTALTMRNTIATMRLEQQRDLDRQLREQMVQGFQANAAVEAKALFMAGNADFDPVTGLPVDNKVLTDPATGQEIAKVSANEIRRIGTLEAGRELEAQLGKDTPEFMAKITPLLDKNNVTYPRWEATFTQGIQEANLPEIVKPEAVSANTVKAYELFKQIGARSQTGLIRHLGGGDNEAYRLFSTAMILQQVSGDADPRAALFSAIRARQSLNRGMGVALPSAQDKRTGTINIESGIRGARNGSIVLSHWNNLVDARIGMGVPAAEAMIAASNDINSLYMVNGKHAVFVGRETDQMREVMQAVTQPIIEQWVKDNPNSGYDADDIALAPDGNGGYYLTGDAQNGLLGMPLGALTTRPLITYTRGDLMKINATIRKQSRNEAIERATNKPKQTKLKLFDAANFQGLLQ